MRSRMKTRSFLVGAAALGLALAVPALAVEPQAGAPSTTPEMPGKLRFVAVQGPDDMLLSSVRGTDVRNKSGESIGHVDDVVLDKTGKASAIIVAVGGIWGLGAKDIGVAFDSVQFQHDQSGKRVAMLDANKDTLEAAPKFQKTETSSGRPATQ